MVNESETDDEFQDAASHLEGDPEEEPEEKVEGEEGETSGEAVTEGGEAPPEAAPAEGEEAPPEGDAPPAEGEEAPAEEAPAEEAPAEEAPAEEAPAEGEGEPPGDPGDEPPPGPGDEPPPEEEPKKEEEEDDSCKICGHYLMVIGPECLVIHANEPWPKDVQLFQPYEVEQILLPDNANCLAVQAFLKMCKLDYKVTARANAEAMSPSGKVPFIKCGQFIISELEGIVQFCNSKGISLSNDLDKDQKSDMRAYMSLIHNVLENAENYICYLDKETYNQVTKPRCASIYPFPLNHLKSGEKKSMEVRKLRLLGWYDKSLEDVYKEVENCCQALTDRLGGNEFFFGTKLSEFDAFVFAHLFTIFTNPLPADDNQFMLKVGTYDKLLEWTKKVDKEVMGRDTKYVLKKWSEMTDEERGVKTKPKKKEKLCVDCMADPICGEVCPPPPPEEEEDPNCATCPPSEEPPPDGGDDAPPPQDEEPPPPESEPESSEPEPPPEKSSDEDDGQGED